MTKVQLLRLARTVARSAGFPSPHALHVHVIHRGWRVGDELRAFNVAQAALLHIVQPLQWAAEATGADRARWVRMAYRGAFLAWLTGQAA